MHPKLTEALSIYDVDIKQKVDLLQSQLESIKDGFFALFWLYSHDFLYVSPSIEKILGHPYQRFENHGMVFFQSIIPPNLINRIYETMNKQALQIEEHPDYIFSKDFLNIKAAVYNTQMEEVPVGYNAVFLDAKAFEPTSYLVLCSWVDLRKLSNKETKERYELIKKLLHDIKEVYISNKPDHFRSLFYRNKISKREKEVALLLMQGHSTKSISDELNISFNTVESHRKNLLEKMNSKNTAELIFKLAKSIDSEVI